MPDVISTLQTSPVTKNLSETEMHKLAEMLQRLTYTTGQVIRNKEAGGAHQFTILARGSISIKLPNGVGESTVGTLQRIFCVCRTNSSTHWCAPTRP
jgi:hypothetical protein